MYGARPNVAEASIEAEESAEDPDPYAYVEDDTAESVSVDEVRNGDVGR
jgi:hypothetical protein